MTQNRYYKIVKDNLVLILVCIFAAVLHFIYLDRAPSGWHVDEAGTALDAWYIAHFGTDRYGYSYPVYFYNYGGGQSALYTYLAALLIKIFGFSLYTVRIPAALASLLPLVSGVVILKTIKSDKKYINIFALIYSVAPYFFMSGRFGLDCNLMLGVSSIFLMCLVFAVSYDRDYLYLISGIAGGIVLYTYCLSYIVMVAFMVFLMLYLLYTKKLTIKRALCLCIPMGLLAVPLALEQFNNIFGSETITIWKFTFVKFDKYRIGELGAPDIRRLVSLVKTTLLHDNLGYNTNSRFFTLYWVSIPFFVIGLLCGIAGFIKSLRERRIHAGYVIFLWLTAESIMAMMLKCEINANRVNGIYFAVLLCVVYGIWNAAHRIKWERAALGGVTAIYIVMAFLFFRSYYKVELNIHREYFGYTTENVLADIDSMEELAQYRVCIGGYFDYNAISRLLLNDSKDMRSEIESDRYIHGLPDNPEYGMCYILLDTDWEYCDKLYQLGLKVKEYEKGIKLFYPG